jgi:AraC-like DNA-binding protein/quercetin dioxygenase-like cupin family protein
MSKTRTEWRPAQVAELPMLPQPVHMRAFTLQAGTRIAPHRHDWTQFLFARTGTMQVMLESGTIILPPQFGLWIPEGVEHSVSSVEDSALETLHIKTSALENPPDIAKTVLVDEFVRTFIHYACTRICSGYDMQDKAADRLHVLLGLLEELPDAAMNLIMPRDPKLADLCLQMQTAPNKPFPLEECAAEAGMSPRTLLRRFVADTGLTYQAWRHRLRLMVAIEKLCDGESVTNVAMDIGYSTTSSFTQAFQREFGRSPTRFNTQSLQSRRSDGCQQFLSFR